MTQKFKTALHTAGKQTVREYLWGQVRLLKTFTTMDLAAAAPRYFNLELDKVRYYVNGWVKSGHLTSEVTKVAGARQEKSYTLVKDTGIQPPRVDPKGRPVKTGLAREQMWRTMRMIGQFNYQQLAATASTDEVTVSSEDARKYVELLHKAHYLQCTKSANHSGGLALYMLKAAAWTGNKPPMIRRQHVVFDQNLHEIMWPKDEDIESEY